MAAVAEAAEGAARLATSKTCSGAVRKLMQAMPGGGGLPALSTSSAFGDRVRPTALLVAA